MPLIGKKMIRLLSVVFTVSALTFLMVDLLPGDAAYDLVGREASLEDVKNVRRELGLDRHIAVRYLEWLGRVVKGDLGRSYLTGEKVGATITTRLPVTLELMILAQIMAVTLAVPAGVYSAYREGSLWDRAFCTIGFSLMAMPMFVLSLFMIFIFAINLHLLPATGYVPFSHGLIENLISLLLPASSIALVEWVPLMRVLRSDMIATLKEDYILMARSKGLPITYILFRHALKPSSFTLFTILGIQIGHLIGGALIVEIIFALPGLGRLLVGAIFSRDAPMVQGCILFITVGYVCVNVAVDLLYAILDPRIRKQGPSAR